MTGQAFSVDLIVKHYIFLDKFDFVYYNEVQTS